MPTQPPEPGLIEHLQTMIGGAATALIASLVGRAMYHADEVRAGRRKPFGWFLAWEIPTAVGMALVGEACADWRGFSRSISVGVIAVAAYLGPRGAGALLERWSSSRIGK